MDQTESEYDKEKFSERLAKLTGGVAIIRVGAATEAEMKQTKGRVEDALHATRAAVAEGIVPGGGVALLRCIAGRRGRWPRSSRATRRLGAEIVARALTKPVRTIAENCGKDGAVVADEVRRAARRTRTSATTPTPASTSTCSRPASSTRPRSPASALQNAASIAGLMLTTEVMITKIDEDDKKSKVSGRRRLIADSDSG